MGKGANQTEALMVNGNQYPYGNNYKKKAATSQRFFMTFCALSSAKGMDIKMNKISIVIPCFNEEEALPVYYEEMSRIMKQMQGVDFELLFVDDGSSDRTLGIMKSLHERDERCKYLSFSRNFGKEAAIYAGLSNAEGNYVAIMDVDLQDPPSLLPEMYRTLVESRS